MQFKRLPRFKQGRGVTAPTRLLDRYPDTLLGQHGVDLRVEAGAHDRIPRAALVRGYGAPRPLRGG